MLYYNGLVIKPSLNLIENIGVGHPFATHTKLHFYQKDKVYNISVPLRHPKEVKIDYMYDYKFVNKYVTRNSLLKELLKELLNVLNKII